MKLFTVAIINPLDFHYYFLVLSPLFHFVFQLKIL